MAQNDIDDVEIVGFENEAEKIIQYLIRGTNDLDVVPIVGMGGHGKTTLARKVYDNKGIVAHFDVRVWCIISQTYNRRELLQEIFSQVTGSKDEGVSQVSGSKDKGVSQITGSDDEGVSQVTGSNDEGVSQVTGSDDKGVSQVTGSDDEGVSQVAGSDDEGVSQVTGSKDKGVSQVTGSDGVSQVTSSDDEGVSQFTGSNDKGVSQVTGSDDEGVSQCGSDDEIFSEITGSKDKGDQDDEDGADVLADKLKKSLAGKRYLIVLDDMWDDMAWDDLRLCFPDVGKRSRIVITTRLEEVAKQVKYHIDPYYLPFLTPADSLKLLQKKVFQEENFPPELQNVSIKIAEKCKGLPLVVILVAGIIKRNKMEASWWHEVKTSLLSYLGESEGYALSTIQLSYDNLPEYLKPCLLYMGMFPEDARIPVSKLISLWIAEGFVQNIESAEGYLMDLISSNVVIASKRGYNGKVKYCQVHDVVLHFCLERSREEKFMLAVKGLFQLSHWEESRVSFSYSNELSRFAFLGSTTKKPFHQQLKSLISTNPIRFSDWHFFHKISEMRLLEVLDLSSHRALSLSSATFQPLIHLKYLAVCTEKFQFHPQSHLPHLETVIVENHEYSKLPATFWKMEKLRHVHFIGTKRYLEKDEQRMFEESPKLENLRILRGVTFQIKVQDDISFIEDVLLRRCPNLQQLDICLTGNYWPYAEAICLKLECLAQLQSLRITFHGLWLHLPSNLKKLVLSEIHVGSAMSLITGLPGLEHIVLKVIHNLPKEWCLGDITFHKLKFLKLVHLDISQWDASEGSFPLLERLVIQWCDDLEEIPLSFADILPLKQIKLIGRPKESLKASALKIKEYVEENEGCDRINLIITEFSEI